jgi:HK97 family phage prohead protease
MKVQSVTFKAKAGPSAGLAEGQFEGYASVFGNKDSYGDVVMPGAFTNTLADWKALDAPIPLLWSHRMDDPDMNIGSVEAAQDDHGLKVVGTLDMDSPKAAQVYRLLKSGRVQQMSFAYDVIDGAQVTKDGDSAYELRDLKLYEVSVVPIGANQETEILAVKTAAELLGTKEGRVLAAKHIDSLRSAHEAIGAVITAAEKAQDDQDKASGNQAVKGEGGDVKPEDPPASPSAKNLATRELHLLALNS